MSDRELLEMAAKAAGIVGAWNERGECIHVTTCAGMTDVWWRPLEDDGDALRLAVSLEFNIDVSSHRVSVIGMHSPQVQEIIDDRDIQEMTRRAIVRSAAEIGRAMP